MTAAGLIFSNIHDQAITELTNQRTMASVPFGCRYRLIDFALSNMVNSDITKVGIVTHNNYQSLLDHIGTGKDWDLSRRSGGIKLLPPFIASYTGPEANKLYSTRLEALMGVTNFINRCKEDVLVLSDCDAVCNIKSTCKLFLDCKTSAFGIFAASLINENLICKNFCGCWIFYEVNFKICFEEICHSFVDKFICYSLFRLVCV